MRNAPEPGILQGASDAPDGTRPKPSAKPKDPRFSAGPTRKRPGWTLDALSDAALGPSRRAIRWRSKSSTSALWVHSRDFAHESGMRLRDCRHYAVHSGHISPVSQHRLA